MKRCGSEAKAKRLWDLLPGVVSAKAQHYLDLLIRPSKYRRRIQNGARTVDERRGWRTRRSDTIRG